MNCNPKKNSSFKGIKLIIFFNPQVAFDGTRRVCHRCWQRIENTIRPPPVPHQMQEPDVVEPPMQELQVAEYTRAPNTPGHCIFNYCVNESRHRIPECIKVHIFCEYKLYIPNGARVCREHLQGNNWEELPEFCNVTHSFTATQFSDICDILRATIQRATRIDFSVRGALSDDELHFWVGLNNEQLDIILEETSSLTQNCIQPRTTLGIYLTKLRSGEPNERLATLFNMSRRQLERHLSKARECLTNEYVILHLGLDHIDRNNMLERNLTIPRNLFGNEQNTKAILICDGTYIYILKSSNFLFQRQSYSLHKYQNLLKPFLIVCPDGYIVDVKGPYAATKTDANIMQDLMNDDTNPIHIFLEPNDAFILDRGFRDSLDDIEAHGYEYYVPPTKARQETQLSTEQANDARAVTMCRWVVEVVNGRFKRDFKLLRQKYFNRALPSMFNDFKIAAAILNHFHVPIIDNALAEEFLAQIRAKVDLPNLLYNYVERKRLNSRRANFQRLAANELESFPILSEEQIIVFALGTYQLKLARSYCAEHIRNGLYLIEVYRENDLDDLPDYGMDEDVWLLRGRIQSRHVRSRIYYCYILVNNNENENNPIVQHYCTCLTGRRTMGTCAHTLSIIWYLGHARHTGFTAPAAFLNDVIVDET